jgi:hypothetical protein
MPELFRFFISLSLITRDRLTEKHREKYKRNSNVC